MHSLQAERYLSGSAGRAATLMIGASITIGSEPVASIMGGTEHSLHSQVNAVFDLSGVLNA